MLMDDVKVVDDASAWHGYIRQMEWQVNNHTANNKIPEAYNGKLLIDVR